MSTASRVLITCLQLQRTIDEHRSELEDRGLTLTLPEVHGQRLSESEMLNLIDGIDGIVAGDDEITRRVIERADRLRVISKWGVGIDGIDLEAAAERGIVVTNTPGVFGDEVADVVVGYLVMLARGLHQIDAAVRNGMWIKPEGRSLAGQTIGIIGLGDIGREVARRCKAMRMRVIGADISEDSARMAAEEGVEIVAHSVLLGESDVVSLNCPLTPATYHLLGEDAFARMRPHAWVVNTARGPLIDQAALVEALQQGRIAGAALDVFEEEPLPEHSHLRLLDKVILGTHNASNTDEAVRRTNARAIENLISGLGIQ